ncbi:MAG: HAD family hydrolase [Acidimicrobiales bacterium]
MTLEAVVFDFDGLIVDSEWAIYETARAAFTVHGHDLTVEAWATIVGLGDGDDDRAWTLLLAAMGIEDLDREAFSATHAAQDRANRDSMPALPGVEVLVDSLVGADVVGGVGKPAPDVYLRACADLGADPARSVALEDSAHGVEAAKAAGMAAVAVPSRITSFNDFSAADLVVTSLEHVTVPGLASLVEPARR